MYQTLLQFFGSLYWSQRSLKVVSPNLKGFENGKQFLVVNIVVEFGWGEGVGVEGNGVDFIVHQRNHREDGSEGVVWCIHFNDEQRVQDPVCQYQHSGEGLLQHVESGAAFVGEIPRRAFAGKVGEWDSNARVVWNKMPVELSEPQEGMYVFNLAGLRPILNNLDLISSHSKSTQREDIT